MQSNHSEAVEKMLTWYTNATVKIYQMFYRGW